MGWTKLDTALERIRDAMPGDPAGAREEIAALLKETRSPAGRVRLWGVMILACCRLGDLEAGLRAYREGRSIRKCRSPLARAELENDAAELHIYRRDPESARTAVETALDLLRPLISKPGGQSPNAVRVARHIRATFAAALVYRVAVRCLFEGDLLTLRESLADALKALRMVDPRYNARVHLAAVAAVSILVTQVGTPKDVGDVLQLAGEAERLLRRRRVPARHVHRVKLRWIRALACARLGSVEEAERILAPVVEDLQELGLEDDARRAAEHLLWIVAELKGQWGRARDERRRLGLPREMDPPEPPELDELDEPIGF